LNRSVVLQGDGTDPSALAARMAEGAFDAVVVLTRHDSDSLLAGMVAKDHGAKKVIARVDNQHYGPIAQRFGIDALISPRRAVANAILRFVRRSNINSTTMLGSHQGELIDFRVDAKAKGDLLEKPVGALKVPDGCLIGVISHGGEIFIPARNPDERIEHGDHVFVVALREAVPKIEELFG
jgi:trk system potassium uptake protein TrkA